MPAEKGGLMTESSSELKRRVKYRYRTEFHRELEQRVDEYVAQHGGRFGGWRMVLKTIIILSWLAGSFVFLVFFAQNIWHAIIGMISFVLAYSAVGFGIQHDANHDAYSSRKAVNYALGYTLDFIGGSSYYWRYKHNVLHHQFPNVNGMDEDINPGAFLRLSPDQPRYWFHRFQPLYAWVLYGLLAIEWYVHSDFRKYVRGKINDHPYRRPRGANRFFFFFGKVLPIAWAVVLPSFFHPVWLVLLMWFIAIFLVGIVLAVVFQLAHCVDAAETYGLRDESRPDHSWAEHQLATSVDFARGNPVLTWFLGGLNYQAIHHLFPKISHRHYPAISRIVEEVAAKHGVTYRVMPSFWAGFLSHVSFLRRLGMPDRSERPAASPAA
jgi:linoleoyl-CoA desaturase